MFLGTYEPRMDNKGRLILPARFRDQLASGIVLTKGQERCVYGFTSSEFTHMYQELRKAPLSSKQARDYVRVMLSGAIDEIPDKQGRVTVPSQLRQYAGLDKELVVIGAGARIEIWNKQAWEDYLREQEDCFATTAEEILPGMF